jgi:hypothetical protein
MKDIKIEKGGMERFKYLDRSVGKHVIAVLAKGTSGTVMSAALSQSSLRGTDLVHVALRIGSKLKRNVSNDQFILPLSTSPNHSPVTEALFGRSSPAQQAVNPFSTDSQPRIHP